MRTKKLINSKELNVEFCTNITRTSTIFIYIYQVKWFGLFTTYSISINKPNLTFTEYSSSNIHGLLDGQSSSFDKPFLI